jgi:ribonuclease BN (tRNA processing enzyme)
MDADYFPVALGDMSCTLRVHEFKGEAFRVGDATVASAYLNHPGMTLGYRVSCAGKSLVYATDNEPYQQTLTHLAHRAEAGREFGQRLDAEFIQFLADADLYIGEAQYTDEEYLDRIGWGHSTIAATVEAALAAQVRSLAFFHHDPLHDDDAVTAMAESASQLIHARGAQLNCFAAREGQVIDL